MVIYSINGKKIILEINFDEMKIRNLKNDKFGFYIELMFLDKNYIYIIDRSVDDDTYPQSIIISGGDYEK
ncbi:unknown [Coprobacillus sp. CAG:698]|nr:unknown [Coprobacillus sp. CAG:698]